MSTAKILVPFDFSKQSTAALEMASAFAAASEAELLILHVVEDDFQVYFSYGNVSTESAMRGLFDALHDVQPKGHQVECIHRLVEGRPADVILKVANEESVDMIVMGTHGRSGLPRMILGSVAEEVVRKAICPVLTMREPAVTAAEACGVA